MKRSLRSAISALLALGGACLLFTVFANAEPPGESVDSKSPLDKKGLEIAWDDDSDSDSDRRHARAERCAQGTYYIVETGGAQDVWSLSPGGIFQGINSAERVFNFSSQLGRWEIVAHDPIAAEATYFDFTHQAEFVEPLFVARVDIWMGFGDKCETIEGWAELRFFLPWEDPLDPNGVPVYQQVFFEGRRVR